MKKYKIKFNLFEIHTSKDPDKLVDKIMNLVDKNDSDLYASYKVVKNKKK